MLHPAHGGVISRLEKCCVSTMLQMARNSLLRGTEVSPGEIPQLGPQENVMRLPLACLALSLLPSVVWAQAPDAIVVHAGIPKDVYATPATMDLIPKEAGAHTGKVWVRSTDDGLQIWGQVQVNDNDLHWPQEKSEMLSSDHIEIWLAASKDVSMPPVGYGNQFVENHLKSAADCTPLENEEGPGSPRSPKIANCERWYNEQLQYRKQFQRLFVRQWLAASSEGVQGRIFEDFASTAFANLKTGFYEEELPTPLAPKSKDGVVEEIYPQSAKHETRHDAAGHPYDLNIITGYTFHFSIPYSAFPPAQQLNLRDLWVMVDVFGAAPEGKKMGALSTTSPQRVWGRPSTFNHLMLETPRVHSITPCATAPTDHDMYGNPHPAWYFPMAGKEPLYLSTVYDIENPAGGYMYDPAGVSPIFSTDEHFWKTLPNGASVCGPGLTYRKGDTVESSTFSVAKQYFDTKALPDGWTLVRTGPDMSTQSPFGSGQCGACPVLDFHIYAVSPMGEISPALDISDEYSGMEDSADDGDLAIAADWSKVTYYREFVTYLDDGKGGKKERWTATSYSLEGHAYKECGKQDQAVPPKPPNYPEINDNGGD
jgi:hypothetical protein